MFPFKDSWNTLAHYGLGGVLKFNEIEQFNLEFSKCIWCLYIGNSYKYTRKKYFMAMQF